MGKSVTIPLVFYFFRFGGVSGHTIAGRTIHLHLIRSPTPSGSHASNSFVFQLAQIIQFIHYLRLNRGYLIYSVSFIFKNLFHRLDRTHREFNWNFIRSVNQSCVKKLSVHVKIYQNLYLYDLIFFPSRSSLLSVGNIFVVVQNTHIQVNFLGPTKLWNTRKCSSAQYQRNVNLDSFGGK